MVLFGLSWFEKHKYFDKIKNLDIPSVCFIYKAATDLQKKIDFCKINQIGLILTPHKQFEKFSKMADLPTRLFPYGFDPSIFKPRNLKKKYDIGFSGALHGANYYSNGAFKNPNIRSKIYDILKKDKGVRLFWKSTDVLETARIHDNVEYANMINQSNAWIATQAAYGDITPRYFEIMGSGSLLFCESNPIEYSHIFYNGRNCIEFDNTLNNLDEKINFIKKNKALIRQLTLRSSEDARINHTWDARALHIVSLIKELH